MAATASCVLSFLLWFPESRIQVCRTWRCGTRSRSGYVRPYVHSTDPGTPTACEQDIELSTRESIDAIQDISPHFEEKTSDDVMYVSSIVRVLEFVPQHNHTGTPKVQQLLHDMRVHRQQTLRTTTTTTTVFFVRFVCRLCETTGRLVVWYYELVAVPTHRPRPRHHHGSGVGWLLNEATEPLTSWRTQTPRSFFVFVSEETSCLLYTSPSPRDRG